MNQVREQEKAPGGRNAGIIVNKHCHQGKPCMKPFGFIIVIFQVHCGVQHSNYGDTPVAAVVPKVLFSSHFLLLNFITHLYYYMIIT